MEPEPQLRGHGGHGGHGDHGGHGTICSTPPLTGWLIPAAPTCFACPAGCLTLTYWTLPALRSGYVEGFEADTAIYHLFLLFKIVIIIIIIIEGRAYLRPRQTNKLKHKRKGEQG